MSRKLFVLVRADLPGTQKAVQAAHAVARFCSSEFRRWHWNGRETESVPPRWDDETLVILKAKDLKELEELRAECQETWPFYEPDIGNEMTAFAVLTPPDWFDMLKLL
jgi:peptidyl-tRNA hydrolase